MPPDEGAVLSDRDAADIYAHLRQMQAFLTVALMTNLLPILSRYSAA
jgi:hypothetical protein